ncbi:hypothetical protein AB1L88_17115 [Tautonia sp. JC769]|uniref:hypothetical protein n=1 Tax=Tautonia sp. JC769 TaxID=3232135 RepID=UPI00345A19AB
MQRRDLLSTVGLGAAAAMTMGPRSARADEHEGQQHDHGDSVAIMEVCARACNDAARHCLDQLRKGAEKADYHATSVDVTTACQEFCLLSAQLMARHSELQTIAHEANARACDACAEVCEQSDAQVMKDCAEKCRECAEHCRKMAREGHHHG